MRRWQWQIHTALERETSRWQPLGALSLAGTRARMHAATCGAALGWWLGLFCVVSRLGNRANSSRVQHLWFSPPAQASASHPHPHASSVGWGPCGWLLACSGSLFVLEMDCAAAVLRWVLLIIPCQYCPPAGGAARQCWQGEGAASCGCHGPIQRLFCPAAPTEETRSASHLIVLARAGLHTVVGAGAGLARALLCLREFV